MLQKTETYVENIMNILIAIAIATIYINCYTQIF